MFSESIFDFRKSDSQMRYLLILVKIVSDFNLAPIYKNRLNRVPIFSKLDGKTFLYLKQYIPTLMEIHGFFRSNCKYRLCMQYKCRYIFVKVSQCSTIIRTIMRCRILQNTSAYDMIRNDLPLTVEICTFNASMYFLL